MNVEQLYTQCLAQGAYFIESNGEAAVIDPLREVDQYIQMAANRGAKIKYVFETHFHADFVSGHVDLAEKTGATIVYGPTQMKTGFPSHIAKDGQEFSLGKIKLRLIHTPGHTMESSCYLLIDEAGKETVLFTGDTLFIGDVGRPDLAQHVITDLTERKLAKLLFKSLHEKLATLPDEILVYPGHGAGSACGKNIGSQPFDTLGHQRKTNYALKKDLSEEAFVESILSGLTPPPGYFPNNVLMNIRGYERIDHVIEQGTSALTINEFGELRKRPEYLVLDTRSARQFAMGHIPNSWNIGIDGSFAVWAGTVIKDIGQKILLVADPGREREIVTRLARVGYDHVQGFLQGGFGAWKNVAKTVAVVDSIDADSLADILMGKKFELVDIRKRSEFESEHVVGAMNVPLDYINSSPPYFQSDKTYYIHCASGYRSMVFISIMKSRGFHNLVDVTGGFVAIKKSGNFNLTDYVCPSTML